MENESQNTQTPINKNNNIIIIILITVIVGLTAFIVYDKVLKETKEPDKEEGLNNTNNDIQTPKNSEDKLQTTTPEEPIALEKGTFKYANRNGFGTVQVEGYITFEKLSNCTDICSAEETDTYDYALFNITKLNNNDFSNYIESLEGNSFASTNAIGIGCINNNKLTYINGTDTNGLQTHELSNEDTTKILNSTKENPIILELSKEKFTNGGGAPQCYSHISTIKVK